MNITMQKTVFGATSRVTEVAPVLGARLLDAVFYGIVGSALLAALFERGNRKVMKRVTRFRRFLVVADIHLGDAVLAQSALVAIRDFFPSAEIDYVINALISPLIEGNPDATRVIPLFSNSQFPSPAETAALREMVRTGHYDLVIMLCPFLSAANVVPPGQPILDMQTHGAIMLRNERKPALVNHFAYQEYCFVRGALGMAAEPVRDDAFRGVRTTYSDEAMAQASSFARAAGAEAGAPVIMYNPDSASKYNLMPFGSQVALLERLARDTSDGTVILLGEGHTAAGIGIQLRDALPPPLQAKVRLIPKSMGVEAFGALIDAADVFVTGDTGPLHLAASRKYSRTGHFPFRNQTAILSFFGATTPRMSGYDSFQPGYLDSNQDAPAWCYQADSPCRNISCLNKMYKTCKTVRCFEHVDVNGMATLVASYLDGRRRSLPAT